MSDVDYQQMADQIQSISDAKSEEELYEVIGNGLYDLGYDVAEDESDAVIAVKHEIASYGQVNLSKAFSFVADNASLTIAAASSKGRGFWDRFEKKVKHFICTNPDIQELMNGNGSLREYVKVAIGLILSALGIVALSPVALGIITAVIALIVKIGWQAYCDVQPAAI